MAMPNADTAAPDPHVVARGTVRRIGLFGWSADDVGAATAAGILIERDR